MKKIAITTGDPAGIGPEISTKALRFYPMHPRVAYILYGHCTHYQNGHHLQTIRSIDDVTAPGLYLIPVHDDAIVPGKPSAHSGRIALDVLQRVSADLVSGALDAVVTCPVSKHEIRKSDPGFIGHTEFFAQAAGVDDAVMAFWSEKMQVALLTTHLGLKDVSAALDANAVLAKLAIIARFATVQKQNPRMAMLALNPHAGEEGAFGNEDAALAEMLKNFTHTSGIQIDGPFPADTFFASKAKNYDMIISPYHDQGLIPFKSFVQDGGVNTTLGLPFVRTSVDHGTAFDIAGKGCAREGSLEAALFCAEKQLGLQKKEAPAIYNHFAAHYDTYMGHVQYAGWIDLVLEQYYRRHGKNPGRVLELACGTANIACELVKRGMRVDASDYAPAMLKIAAEKPFAPILKCADMTAPLPQNTYDLILCLFDSINYLLNTADVAQLFTSTAQGLTSGGLFIFDISTIHNCEENFDGYVNIEDTLDEYLIHTSEYDPEERLQQSQFTFFRNTGFGFQRYDEIHQQKIYTVVEVMALLEISPLKLLGIYGPDQQNLKRHVDMGLDEIHGRLFFVCAKA